MFERFAKSARAAVTAAYSAADRRGDREITTAHLLLGIIQTADPGLQELLAEAGIEAESVAARIAGRSAAAPLGQEDAESLKAIGIDLDAVRERIKEAFGEDVLDQPVPLRRGRRWPFGNRVAFMPAPKKALELSVREAVRRQDGFIGSEHLLLGLLRAEDPASYSLMTARIGAAELRAKLNARLDTAA
jgi:ATP-dependent Clp protease ATP-binding subunit ClpA